MKILFLCTGNSCRSILSEALFNAQAPTGFQACSAGSHPSGQVHPLTLKTLQSLNIPTEHLSSKNMQACEAFAPEIVVTVCSEAANEACPLYLGNALKVHWGLDDPSHLNLPEEEKLQAFNLTVQHIQRRFDAFFALNFEQMDAQQLTKSLENIALIG
ncbi:MULTISPECIES: arsenate reductase ArsC [Acinetobacter]|uniref:Arsenate reductase ArsC n=1 Tax=Acinetobacter piscicola TaxID=2006115 RepID=A0A4Q4GZ19_9GAMM|nr:MULTISPECIES: arsenate reductase ArsC [Acinetobacter]MDM1757047.1 arsenate reductase ArsC [Acinetobacter sp. 256-1]MDM1760171.1 arsenate reductase ArsC [Acinetobacter sp. 251-1]QOW46277.1 arsenate reductase ArsC [Acinetobacter piscicola]RYL27070.1 arsenate reductase ArsC [Acinetobacter piscicola]